MNDQGSLFRMNFIIQDNTAMTLETNLVKIIEEILFNEIGDRLTIAEISELIKERFDLCFSDDEIKTALRKKGKHIQNIGNSYLLKPDYRKILSNQEDFNSKLTRLAQQSIKELDLNVSIDYLIDLLKEYLYFCFNSNKNSILALLDNTKGNSERFKKDESDIKLINLFLNWKNEEKNKFVYNIVSYGYIYCSLTVKKDEMLSNRLFRGKNFILDANIIFRLAGINNDVRMNTIKSFVEKCKEVGVTLSYTTATLDEIKRVIVSKVLWIKEITGDQEPLNLSQFDSSNNDFYSIYCDWSSRDVNVYNDYQGFQNYLTRLVINVLNEISSVDIPDFSIKKVGEFENYIISLKDYKEKHSAKKQSKASLQTDVNNYLYLKSLRKKDKDINVWTTNDYFISTDQNLIGWSLETDNGIPIVVLPSVWLTIMLRFSGRTANDYKAFCSFLELRSHLPGDTIDVYQLLKNLSEKTTDNELKRIIVQEVFEHKDDYVKFIDDDYDEVTNKAFDKVIDEKKLSEQQEIDGLKREYEKKEKELENFESQKRIDDEFKIQRLVEADVKKHFKILNLINSIKIPMAFIIFLVLLFLTIMAIDKKGPLYAFIIYYEAEAVSGMGNILSSMGLFWAIIVVIAGFMGVFISSLCSDKRIERYRNKRTKYYKRIFE